jgi:hypothetical protein
MTDQPPQERLTPASRDDLADILTFALRFRLGKRFHDADDSTANIVAAHLLDHLEARATGS